MNNVKELTQKTIFDIYEKQYPKIVEGVKKSLSGGATSKEILSFFQKKLGKNSATANHIYLVAEHLKSIA